MAAFSPKANPAEPTKKAIREVFENVWVAAASVCSSLFALLVAVQLGGFSAGTEGTAA